MKRLPRGPIAAGVVALLAGVLVFAIATTVFAYHSNNHDEGVYLLHAAMLLEGQLELQLGELAGAFRPWFFVEEGGRAYPKYAPVPAAMYAVSMALFGEPRVTLAAIAAGNTAMVYFLGTMTFDRRVGVVAAILFAASPLALMTTSVFLPYAPTTFLNLLFAFAYLRSLRDDSVVAAAVAGIAIGLAFFARPLTAVLFATPFVLHAVVRAGSSVREDGLVPVPGPVRRHGVTASFGLLLVGITLAYNARMTGSALLFPYEVFAPLDGPGFGHRRILGHSLDYTPALALWSNGYVLWYLATRWFTAGPVGTGLAVAGLVLAGRRWIDERGALDPNLDAVPSFERTAGVLFASLFVTVPAGNVLFWGNRNILATIRDPTDGLLSQFGPIYHFDLLLPLSLFGGVAVVVCWQWLPRFRTSFERRFTHDTARVLVIALLATSLVSVGAVQGAVVSGSLDRNVAVADKHEHAYEPFEATSFDDALVFLPTPYGPWQQHPFQYLRNEPGFDGPVVYALDRDPEGDFAVLDAYPDRTSYRYTYRGGWTPDASRHVVPTLQPLEVRSGRALNGETIVGIPDRVDRAIVRLESDGDAYTQYTVEDPGESVGVSWSLTPDAARLDGTTSTVRLGATDTVVVTITLVQPDGSTLTYRSELAVRTHADGVEVIWPPERFVCPLVTDCGSEGTYLPDDPTAHPDEVWFETRIEPSEEAADADAEPVTPPN